MKEIIGTLAIAIVNQDGFLMSDSDGRALVFKTMESADSTLLTDPTLANCEATIIDISAPENVADIDKGSWHEWEESELEDDEDKPWGPAEEGPQT